MTSSAAHYEIQSQRVTFPVEVREAASGSAGFLVPSHAATRLIPDAFEVAEFLPGRALCTLVLVDYRDNDLGDYNEMAVGFMVRPRGQSPTLPRWSSWKDMVAGRLSSHITHMPVDQSFTRDAGSIIWGYPKTVQQIEIDYQADTVTGRLTYDGDHAFTLSVPRGGTREVKESEITTLSMINDVPHQTRATQTLKGMGLRFGGARLEIGTGTIAEELRSLGLPRRSIMTTWIENMSASFGPPQPL